MYQHIALKAETNIRYVNAERTHSLRASAGHQAPLIRIHLDFSSTCFLTDLYTFPVDSDKMLLIKVIVLLTFLNRTLAILIPPANPAINLAAGSSVPSINSLNASSGPICDSIRYGGNLNRRSCVEALERLVPPASWQDRSVAYVNRDKDISGERIVLPWRELSCTSHP